MRTVCVITGTRADYGLLSPLMRRIAEDPDLELQVLATCMHLSPAFGETVRLIEADGFRVDGRAEMLDRGDSALEVAEATGRGLTLIARELDRLRPDVVVVLGDRFEALAAATAAFLLNIPVAHVHGGELTEGALDDGIRHAITKLSLLHFTATERYRSRVIQLGEQPERVFSVGALGIDNVVSAPLLDAEELAAALGIPLGRPLLTVTFHPVTLEGGREAEQVRELLGALARVDGATIVFTRPNADPGNRVIRDLIDAFVERTPGASAFDALGHVRYLSLVRAADVVVGNSSSGIIEAPALGTPVVNIGTRQDGRIRPSAVIDCAPAADEILAAIERSLTPDAKQAALAAAARGPYGDGHAAERIVDVLRSAPLSGEALRKRFFDLPEACS